MLQRSIANTLTAMVALLAGCNLAGPNRNYDAELAHYKQIAGTVEHPQLTTPPSDNLFTPQPRTIDHDAAPRDAQEWWDMPLEEAVQTALARSSVLRDLGGSVIRTPDSTKTILGPSLVATEPRFGMEAALSEFDATLASSVTAEKNDRMINNFVASGGTRFFEQDLINFQSQISKVGVAGTRMTLRGISTYDFNNASFNRFPSVWDSMYEAEIRQPLYQGAGARFNRLAGPNAIPGFYNGVLIARVNTDISVAEFEIGLRDLVSNVENAYWDLYFAYRDLDAKIQARNAALEAWQKVKLAVEQGQQEGSLEREAQAREQYFRFEEDVQNALAGTLQSSTTNNNGSSGGSFRGLGGVLVSERRLRLAIGLPITDGRMIRPADEPTAARVAFDWPMASDDAIARRPELLRQRLAVKRREMEFVASRNFLLPRFDVLGRYRVRGLGKGLLGDVALPPDPVGDPAGLFENSSLENLALGNFQEWQLGGEVTLPVGFRRGHAAVRNAQLLIAREKAVLEEQERQVIHDLSNALGDVERAYTIMQSTYNRRLAAQQNVQILRARIEGDQSVSAEQMLEAERRFSEADIQYHKALVEHMLAIKNVHFEKGSLLEYCHVMLAEHVSIVNSRPPAHDATRQPTPAAPPAETMPAPVPMPAPAPMPQPPPMPAPPPPPAPELQVSLPPTSVLAQTPPATASIMTPSPGLPRLPTQPEQVATAIPPPQLRMDQLPPAPPQPPLPPLTTPPAPPLENGLPPLAPQSSRRSSAPLLQWSRPEAQTYVSVPADPFQAPAQPAPAAPPVIPATPMPAPQVVMPVPQFAMPAQVSTQVPQTPIVQLPPPPARPSTGYIEQLWYSRQPSDGRAPTGPVAVPMRVPTAPPPAAAWQPPVAPPQFANPQFAPPQFERQFVAHEVAPPVAQQPQQQSLPPSPPQDIRQFAPSVVPQQPTGLPVLPPQSDTRQFVPPVLPQQPFGLPALPPQYEVQPIALPVLPRQPAGLPPTPPPPPPAVRLPQPATEAAVRLPQPVVESLMLPTHRLPQPAPDARSENEMQRLPLPYP